ncbi:MAG: site-specific integrase [Solirubrobacteraceae bacterium]|nr:site-specific integrase [Solirubrobacteraceae bacterium]
MARPATGTVVEKRTSRGTSYGIRFRAHGKRRFQHVGYSSDGCTKRLAEIELANVLADVRRGQWAPPDASTPPEPVEIPTFHVFASEWLEGRKVAGLRPRTIEYLEWALTEHLLAHFAAMRVDQITVEEVDRYARRKAAETKTLGEGDEAREVRRLSNTTINKTLDVLSGVLEAAVEYGHLQRNPAKGKRRRLPADKPTRSWLDRADHIGALLDGAQALDKAARERKGQRRALLATLAYAGLRIGEMLDLTWGDVDLARGTITVRESKTDAGVRVVNVLPALRDELAAYRATLGDVPRGALVFATGTGGRQSETNVRRRILQPAVKNANERLAKRNSEPLPERLTPHSLRRTFASILVALGEDPAYVIGQLGHTDPTLTLRIYARQMSRRDGERERLKALVNGEEWAPAGTSGSAEGLVAAAQR